MMTPSLLHTIDSPLPEGTTISQAAPTANSNCDDRLMETRRRWITGPSTEFSLFQERLRENEPLVLPEGNRSRCFAVFKRCLDLLGSLLLLAILSPLLLTITVVLTATTGGHPFFVQKRVGFRGLPFPMIKFRTMRLDADRLQSLVRNQHTDGPIFKNRHDPRITTVGRWLRRTSLDETPQLINVLLGHMSMVGPRPPLAKEVAQYQRWQRRRLAVMPGLTCLWQVSGRSEIGFEDWVRLDLWYVRNQSMRTDLKLLIKTPGSVLSGRGAY